jgi:hypothetical protein
MAGIGRRQLRNSARRLRVRVVRRHRQLMAGYLNCEPSTDYNDVVHPHEQYVHAPIFYSSHLSCDSDQPEFSWQHPSAALER